MTDKEKDINPECESRFLSIEEWRRFLHNDWWHMNAKVTAICAGMVIMIGLLVTILVSAVDHLLAS